MLTLNVFFSWQSKTDKNRNWYFIREAIQRALKTLKNSSAPELYNVAFEYQESTSGESGMPDIVQTVDNRIANCDIYIADLSIISEHLEPEPPIANNVLAEFGEAKASVGLNQIIGVANKEYGSYKQDPKKLPFDIDHDKAPIEYTPEDGKDALAKQLVTAIRLCVKTAILKRKTRYQPFESWEEYGRSMSWEDNYISNPKFEEVLAKVRNLKYDLRIIGISGMGKSRAVYEAFRDADKAYSNQFLYLNIGEYDDITDIKPDISKAPDDFTLVLDNIDADDLRDVMRWRRKSGKTNPIISLFNDPDEINLDKVNDIEYIIIRIGDMASVIDQMLAQSEDLPDDISRRIRDFADGVPFMAEMMLKNYRDQREDYAKLTDTSIVARLLPGINEQERHILRSCAIFKQIGYEQELESEIRLILNSPSISPHISGDEQARINLFRELKEKCLQIGIFEKRGRYFHIRPRPLAFYLAGEWFKGCDSQRLTEVIQEIQAYSQEKQYNLLAEAICDQIKYLSNDDKAKQLFDGLLHQGNPFDNAELLNTELGSRLFRTFAEVNPEATADCLWRLLSPMTIDQLKAIEEGRRYLIWALEKICFNPSTFERGAKMMMRLAVAENEPNIGNNATGVLKDLFHVLLPGTLADLSQRAKVLDWAMSTKETTEIGLACLRSSLATDHFVYMAGAETFGTKKLEHYNPTYGEMQRYWAHTISLLTAAYDNGYEDEVTKTVEKTIYGLTQSRCFSQIQPLVAQIAEKKNWLWEEMRDSFDLIVQEYLPILSEDEQAIVKDYQHRLTPTDFVSRVGMVESRFRYRDAGSWQEERKLKHQDYQKLAQEFLSEGYLSEEIVFNLYARYDKDAFVLADFGYFLGEACKEEQSTAEAILDYSIAYFLKNEYAKGFRLSSFFFTFLQGYGKFDYVLERLRAIPELNYMLFTVLGIKGTKVQDTDELFQLVSSGKCDVSHFLNYCNRINWLEQEDGEVLRFFDRLIALGRDGQKVVLKEAHNRLFWREDSKSFDYVGKHVVEAIVTKKIVPDVNAEDYLEYVELALEHLDVPELAIFINDLFVEYYTKNPFTGLPGHDLEKIYRLFFTKYFDVVWPVLSRQLVDEETRIIVFQFKYLFGAMIGGLSGGVMFAANHDEAYIQWCKDCPEQAPWIMAMFTPVFAGEEYHPIVKFLISEYADRSDVMSTLSSNMNSFSWTGSIVPLYRKRKAYFEKMLPMKNPAAQKWVEEAIGKLEQQIAWQEGREAEEDLIRSN